MAQRRSQRVQRSHRARSRSYRASYRRGRFRAVNSNGFAGMADAMKTVQAEALKILDKINPPSVHDILNRLNTPNILAAHLYTLSIPIAAEQSTSNTTTVVLSNYPRITDEQNTLEAANVFYSFATDHPQSEPHQIIIRGTFSLAGGKWFWNPSTGDEVSREYVGTNAEIQLLKDELIKTNMTLLQGVKNERSVYAVGRQRVQSTQDPSPQIKWVKRDGGWVEQMVDAET